MSRYNFACCDQGDFVPVPRKAICKFTNTVSYSCLIAALLGLCVPNPSRSAELAEQGPPVVRLPVYFATDRQMMGRKGVPESATLGPLKFGMSSITVPTDSHWLEANSLRADMLGMGWRTDPSSKTFAPVIEDRGYVAEGDKEQIVAPATYPPEFWNSLSDAIGNSRGKRVYIFIHGFATSGINSIYTGGILSSQVEAPVVVFSWPSDGIAGAGPGEIVKGKGSFSRLNKEESLIQEPQILSDLSEFLNQASTKLKNAKDVQFVLVAHSLGNRILARYFESRPQLRFAGVYFIAADLSKELFYRALPGLKKQSAHTVVYSNPKDKVLYASSFKDILYGGIHKKLGLSKFDVPGIEFINYESVAEPKKFVINKRHQVKHYLPFEHFGSIARSGQPHNADGSDTSFVLLKNSTITKAGSKNRLPGIPFI